MFGLIEQLVRDNVVESKYVRYIRLSAMVSPTSRRRRRANTRFCIQTTARHTRIRLYVERWPTKSALYIQTDRLYALHAMQPSCAHALDSEVHFVLLIRIKINQTYTLIHLRRQFIKRTQALEDHLQTISIMIKKYLCNLYMTKNRVNHN